MALRKPLLVVPDGKVCSSLVFCEWAGQMAHSVANASHAIGRDILNANNQLLSLHQALVMAYICCCAISVDVEGLSHRRGNVLWGFFTSPERPLFIISQQYNIPTMCGSSDRYHFSKPLLSPPRNATPLTCAAAAIRYRQCYHTIFLSHPPLRNPLHPSVDTRNRYHTLAPLVALERSALHHPGNIEYHTSNGILRSETIAFARKMLSPGCCFLCSTQ